MLSRIVAIHGKRPPNYGAIEDARTSANVGNLSPVLQVSGSSRLEECRPKRIAPREPTLNPREPPYMTKMKSLEDLFINLLKDMYYAEKQILKALPKMP